MPDITRAEVVHRIRDHQNNWWTLCYVHMMRFRGHFEDMQLATIYHRGYKNWLETYEMKDNIPPHIAFGGAVVAGEGDPTFYPRWQEYARLHFC